MSGGEGTKEEKERKRQTRSASQVKEKRVKGHLQKTHPNTTGTEKEKNEIMQEEPLL